VYDNFGYLFYQLDLNYLSKFKFPLFWQLTFKQYCFDIIVMKEDDFSEFLELEIQNFIGEMPDDELGKATYDAVKLK
jgi:hypothetical protein